MNNQFLIPFLLSLVAGVSTVLGTIFIFVKVKKINEFITLCLSFSFTIMILISLFDLLPHSILNVVGEYDKFFGLFLCTVVFMIGALSIRKINNVIDKKK